MKDTWTIRCYESDALRHLKPFAFMNTAQELANTHAIQLGFGYNQLIEKSSFGCCPGCMLNTSGLPSGRKQYL